MTINKTTNLTYGNITSEELGLMICDWESINTDSNDEESELITSTTPFIQNWHLHDVQKSAPLTYSVTFCMADGTYIDSDKEREIKKSFLKKKRDWLNFDQDDLYDVFYYCTFLNAKKNNVARMTGGITFNVICDSGHAWSSPKIKSYSCSGTSSFLFISNTDFNDYELYPLITITPTVNGNISINNTTTGNVVTINNCVTSEVITIDGKGNKIKSSNQRVLLDDWNKKYFSFVDGANNISITGNFNMKLEYRLPKRVGG
jgi:phage-related protein